MLALRLAALDRVPDLTRTRPGEEFNQLDTSQRLSCTKPLRSSSSTRPLTNGVPATLIWNV